MADERTKEIQLGLLTMVVLGLFFFTLIWISKGAPAGQQEIAIRFAPTTIMPTIVEGAPIIVGGQTVGKVTAAELKTVAGETKEATEAFVWVSAAIRDDLVLRADCSAIPEAPALGGNAIIKLDLGHKAEILVGNTIEGGTPAGLAGAMASVQAELDGNNPSGLLYKLKIQLDPDAEASLMGKLQTSLDDVNAMTSSLAMEMSSSDARSLMGKIQLVADNINAVTGALKQQFDEGESDVLLSKLHIAMDGLNGSLETISRILRDGESPIARTLANVETTSTNISEQTDPMRPDSLMANFKAAGEKINASLVDLNTVTKTTRDVMVLNRENINRMLVNFKESSDHIKSGVKYVLRNPWRLLNPPNAKEIREQAILDAARSFAEAATRIDDATAQLTALSELHNGEIPIDDPDLERLRVDLKTTKEKYQQAEAKLWEELGRTE